MKKLLTLVLALVMVFAVAVPAMAMTDEALGTVSSTNDNYTLEIALYQANVAEAAPAATFTLPAVQGASRAYVANENVYFGIKLAQKENVSDGWKIPKMMKITSTYSATVEDGKQMLVNADGKVEVVAAANADKKFDSDGKYLELCALDATVGGYTAVKNTNPDNLLSLKGEALYFFGSFVNGSKDFSVKVEIKPVFKMAADGATQYDVDDDMTVQKISDKIFAVAYDKDNTVYTIAFVMDDVGRCKEMWYIDGRSAAIATTATLAGIDGATPMYYNGNAYTGNDTGLATGWFLGKVNTAQASSGEETNITRVFKAMGFDIAKQNTNAVKEKHFIAKVRGVHLEAEVKGAYYTAVVTIPDVTVVEPPKTGDASTMAGFVMIAAAVVAVLGLAYNKVRA